MNSLVFVPILTFVLGLVVGSGGTLLYMRRKIRKMMKEPFSEIGEVLDA